MVKLKLNTVDDSTLEVEDYLVLYGSRFAVTQKYIKRGELERYVTVVHDGIKDGGWMVAQSLNEVIQQIDERPR